MGATVNRLVPVEEATVNRLAVEVVVVPWITSRPKGVVVPMPTLPAEVTRRMEVWLEEATLKGSKVPEPWTLKEIVEEVAFTPATVPLSLKIPGAMALVPWPVKTKPGVKEAAPVPPRLTAN